jgi:hypothetical protein
VFQCDRCNKTSEKRLSMGEWEMDERRREICWVGREGM